MFSFWEFTGGGNTTYDVIVKMWLGVSAQRSFGSLEGKVRGRLLTVHSTSTNNVRNGSSLKAWLKSRIIDDKTDLTVQIWRSQTSPQICEAEGGFLFHIISQFCVELL